MGHKLNKVDILAATEKWCDEAVSHAREAQRIALGLGDLLPECLNPNQEAARVMALADLVREAGLAAQTAEAASREAIVASRRADPMVGQADEFVEPALEVARAAAVAEAAVKRARDLQLQAQALVRAQAP